MTVLGCVWSSYKCRFFRCFWNFGQSFGSHWSISPREIYICYLDLVYLPSLQQKHSCFRPSRSLLFSLLPEKTHSSCVSPQVFSFVGFARSCVSWVILSAVCTSSFLQAIFLHMVWDFFIAFGTCMSTSKGFLVESIFLAFEAPQGSWDALFDPFLTISDLLFLGNVGLYGRFSFSICFLLASGSPPRQAIFRFWFS